MTETEVSFNFRKAQELTAEDDVFTLRTDLSDLLEEHGPGVYTVTLVADLDNDERQTISEYSIFHESRPPSIHSKE